MLKYEELCNPLLDELERGVYKKGDRLPTTPELCRIYGVSNTTVKRAMDELELRGIVARRRGSGVYIKETSTQNTRGSSGTNSGQMSGFTREHEGAGHTVSSKIVDFSVVSPPPEVCEMLSMDTDEFAYHICRVRSVDRIPKVTEYTYMPLKVIPDLRRSHVKASIYAHIEDDLGLRIGSAHRIVKAVRATEDERKWMKLGKRGPLLEVRQVVYLADGTPFEYSISHHTSDYEFYSVSTRG